MEIYTLDSIERLLRALKLWSARGRDLLCVVETPYGCLAFFKDQIDVPDLEAYVRQRFEAARSDLALRL